MVFLQIGGNDLSSVDCSVATLSSNIVSAAEYLICGHGVKHVVIGQLLPRFSARCRSDYNERVIDVNKMVEHKVARSTESVSFWHHRGFWRDPTALLADDGVHVNDLGMVKYAKCPGRHWVSVEASPLLSAVSSSSRPITMTIKIVLTNLKQVFYKFTLSTSHIFIPCSFIIIDTIINMSMSWGSQCHLILLRGLII